MDQMFGGGNKGKKHTEVSRGKDIQMLVDLYRSERIHKQYSGRITGDALNTNVLYCGLHQLHTKSLSDWIEARNQYQHKNEQDLQELTTRIEHGGDQPLDVETAFLNAQDDGAAFSYEGEDGEGYDWDSS